MTVRATDPDGAINSCDIGVDWGNGSEDAPCGVPSCRGEPQGYGAWDPPKPERLALFCVVAR
jgi:hypothetical protein